MDEDSSPCCAAARSGSDGGSTSDATGEAPSETTADVTDSKRMVRLDGGTFTMGTDSDVGFEADGEGPAREVTVDPFYVDRYAVTNAEFYQVVRETGYTTEAEEVGWSFVFEDFVADDDRAYVMEEVPAAPWWVGVRGAYWYQPDGPSSSIEDRMRHPVTQVSWSDAVAFCEWKGVRLPTEAEWEYAARGGLAGKRYPWGDDLKPDGEHRCNIWQGEFPERNTGDDGYVRTAPVTAFEQNDFGLHSVAGNVWEWCSDWFSADHHTTDAFDPVNPRGPSEGDQRVMRGGSYLCHRSWCNRYRVAARSKNTPDSSTGNIGFRTVVDA